jgi:hypothetical protein
MTQNPIVQELLVRGLDAIAKQTELSDLVNRVKNASCWIGMFAEVGGERLAALERCDGVKRRGSQKTMSVVEMLRTTRHDSRAFISTCPAPTNDNHPIHLFDVFSADVTAL